MGAGVDGQAPGGTVARVATGRVHVKWWSAQGLLLHLVVIVVCLGCSIATWWQLGRALGGNDLSWAYTFEWPCFGLYAIVLWWKLLHERAAEDVAAQVAASVNAEPRLSAVERAELMAATARQAIDRATAEEIDRAIRQGGWHP